VRRHASSLRLLVVAVLAALSPLWLGAMLLPLEAAYAEAHHVCACGMAVGTCGCPECEALERMRHDDHASAVPLLKGECDRESGLGGGVHLPPGVLPAFLAVVAPSAVASVPTAVSRGLVSRVAAPPPTPPPRTG